MNADKNGHWEWNCIGDPWVSCEKPNEESLNRFPNRYRFVKDETFIPSETINGLPRKLVNEVRDLLDQFWRKQPRWGDASVEYYYAEQIIRACWKDTALADTILPTYKQDALDKIAAIKAGKYGTQRAQM